MISSGGSGASKTFMSLRQSNDPLAVAASLGVGRLLLFAVVRLLRSTLAIVMTVIP